MKLSDFDFDLPPELIAQQPASQRDASRLLYVNPQGNPPQQAMLFKQLPELLQEGDLLVCNNTKVIPARLRGKRGEATIEVTLHKFQAEGWEAFAKRSKRLKSGDIIEFSADFFAKVKERFSDGRVILDFGEDAAFFTKLEQYGEMPLPPYIKRTEHKAEDDERYQTVFAQKQGAVAAPTAGLHFTEALFEECEKKNITREYVTLHVGGGTFLPVKHEDISEHKMHSEWLEITAQTAQKINEAKRQGRRIVAIGTTSLRSLEAATNDQGVLQPMQGETDIFITPGYQFKMVDALFTNFHLPKSTLFMLVSAFSGSQVMKQAYHHAIEQHMRFFSYGDACLLEKSLATSAN